MRHLILTAAREETSVQHSVPRLSENVHSFAQYARHVRKVALLFRGFNRTLLLESRNCWLFSDTGYDACVLSFLGEEKTSLQN